MSEGMKRFAAAIALASLTATATAAQDNAPEDPSGEEGFSLMERGAQQLLEGLSDEMGPMLRDLEGLADEMGPALRDFALQMGPALRDMMEQVGEWSNYHAPEMLPNGDIIIRRRTEDEGVPPIEDMPQGEEIEI